MKARTIYRKNLEALPLEVRMLLQATVPDSKNKISGRFRTIRRDNFILSTESDIADYSIDAQRYNARPDAKQLCVIGFGDGHLLEAVLKNSSSFEKVNLALVDPDNLDLVMKYRDMSKMFDSKKLNILLGDEASVIEWIKQESWFGRIAIVTNTRFHRYCIAANKHTKTLILYHQMECAFARAPGETDMLKRNIVANSKLVPNDDYLLRWKGKGAGKRAIVIAAGPSLDETIDMIFHLREREKFNIIAIGQVCRKLREKNIKPDMIVYYDYSDVGLSHFDEQHRQWARGIPFFYTFTTQCDIVAMHTNRVYMFDAKPKMSFDEYPKYREKGTIEHANSISSAAIALAAYMGHEDIALLGVDLAYYSGKLHHEGYDMSGQEEAYTKQKSLLLDYKTVGVTGEVLKTSYFMDLDGQWIEQIIREQKLKVLNFGKGRFIRGAMNYFSVIGDTADANADTRGATTPAPENTREESSPSHLSYSKDSEDRSTDAPSSAA